MAVLLVRHAVALPRDRWPADDQARPLNKKGQRQAQALVDQLAPFVVGRVLSSPSLRCVDTVAPLAAARGLAVEPADDLAEGSGHRAAELVRSMTRDGDDIVLCTHGDVIGEILVELDKEGASLGGEDRYQKGSTWLIERRPDSRVRGCYLPPPS